MHFLLALAAAVSAASLLALPRAAQAEEAPRISGPFTHQNLSVYFVHGKSATGPVPLTLQEALDKGAVEVIETGSVNELQIRNKGNTEIFIQSGDIVKGGRQDRVVTVSFLLPAKSGKVPLASFCVEQGRWSPRGTESSAQFSSSAESMPSREAKLAMKAPLAAAPAPLEVSKSNARRQSASAGDETGERQRKVWDEVAKTQTKLSGGVKEKINSAVSESSLQLALENEKLKASRGDYIKALENQGTSGDDIVGYVFAVNGRINSADLYPSNALFRKMWSKLLAASVTEAIGETTGASHSSSRAGSRRRDGVPRQRRDRQTEQPGDRRAGAAGSARRGQVAVRRRPLEKGRVGAPQLPRQIGSPPLEGAPSCRPGDHRSRRMAGRRLIARWHPLSPARRRMPFGRRTRSNRSRKASSAQRGWG